MRHPLTVSVIAFSLFSLAGPLLRLVFPPALAPGRFSSVVNDVILYIWPAAVLGVGQGPSWQTTAALTVFNLLFFAVMGFLVGILAWRAWVSVVLYIMVCTALICIEVWAFNSEFGFLSWCALFVVFLLYAIPFAIVRREIKPNAPERAVAN